MQSNGSEKHVNNDGLIKKKYESRILISFFYRGRRMMTWRFLNGTTLLQIDTCQGICELVSFKQSCCEKNVTIYHHRKKFYRV